MVLVYKISAITLSIKDMERSCKFYSRIPGFKAVYGGSKNDSFTTFKIGSSYTKELRRRLNKANKVVNSCLNLELLKDHNKNSRTVGIEKNAYLGRIIFHTDDVNKLYRQLKIRRVHKQVNKV